MCGERRVERISIHYFSGYHQNQRTVRAFYSAGLTHYNFLAFGHIDVGGDSSSHVVELGVTSCDWKLNFQSQVVISNRPISLTAIQAHARVSELIVRLGACREVRVQRAYESVSLTLLGIARAQHKAVQERKAFVVKYSLQL